MPRHDRLRQLELRARTRRSTSSPCRRARRASRRRRRAAPGSARRREALARVHEPDEPARRLQPERRRHRLLQQRARQPYGRSMLVARAARRRRRRRRARAGRARRVARDERRRGVEDVLARRAVVGVLGDRSRSRRTSGSTGLPAARPSRASARRRALERRTRRRRPASRLRRAQARARPRASRAATRRRRRAARSSSGTKSASNGKEHRLPLALQADVEAQPAVLLLGDELARRLERDSTVGAFASLVGEVDPRQLVPEQAAREDVDVEVRRVVAARASTTNEKRPSASVPQRPQRRSSASQTSIMPSITGAPSPSSSRPVSRTAPGRPAARARSRGRRQSPIA